MSRHPNDKPTPSAEVAALLASVREAFGKKSKKEPSDNDIARERNKDWHAKNAPLGKAAYGTTRPDPEDSQAWRPVALITHIVRQRCQTCGNTAEFIGGEFVKFNSTRQFGGSILRRSEQCPDLFLYRSIEEPIEEIFEEHYQSVARCPGCIAVEKKAVEIWDTFLEGQRKALEGSVDINLDGPFQRTIEDALKEAK